MALDHVPQDSGFLEVTATPLQFSVKDMMDLPVPGQPYGFSTLFRSQQLGDFFALSQLGHPVAELRFSSRTEAERFLDSSLKQV